MKKIIILAALFSLISCSGTGEKSSRQVTAAVKTALEMPSYEYIYDDIIYINRKKDIAGISVTKSELLFAINVNVKAGINLSKGILVEKTKLGKFLITLPSAEILSIDADESTIRQYFIKETSSKVTYPSYFDNIKANTEVIKKDAINRGILKTAEENAKTMTTGIIKSMGISNAEIVFSSEIKPNGKKS